MKPLLACVLPVALLASPALGALSLSLTDGAAPSVYSNGGGTGFGGTLGGGSLSFDVVGSNLIISFTPGGTLNDIVALYLDTRTGGFGDADMNDTGDPGRNVISNLGSSGNEVFPAAMTGGLPDFGVAIGSFGTVVFELNAGNTPNHLGFVAFNGASNISVPLASLGSPAVIDWFAGYASDSNFLSNESMPASAALNGGASPGFGATGTYENFNRFVVPETSAALIGAFGLLGLLRRRR